MPNVNTSPVKSHKDRNRQQQMLKRAYISILAVIALSTIISHGLTTYTLIQQKESNDITFTMTSMHSMVDILIFQSVAYKNSGSALNAELLGKSLARLKAEIAKIEAHKEETINALYHDPKFALDRNFANFILKVEEFAKHQSAGNKVDAEKYFTDLTTRSGRVAIINLDLSLDQYHRAMVKQIKRTDRLQYMSMAIILLLLGIEAAFIVRPMLHRLDVYHKNLLQLALTDELTGLNNRRAFMQLAHAGLSYYRRYKTPFALALMDLDKFKNVNDTYGHAVGDLVLKHYSKLVLNSFRGHDVIGRVGGKVGRIGGEEFAIFLTQTGPDDAFMIIDRLRVTLMDTPCPYVDAHGETRTLSCTASFGIVVVTSGDWSIDELLVRADENLYEAKEKGRNRVIMTVVDESMKPAGAVAEQDGDPDEEPHESA